MSKLFKCCLSKIQPEKELFGNFIDRWWGVQKRYLDLKVLKLKGSDSLSFVNLLGNNSPSPLLFSK